MYTPDFWCVIKVNSNTPHYRIFGSWSGDYLNGSSWRMNSGIVDVEEDGASFLFYGSSGSVYKCSKAMYGCHHASRSELDFYLNQQENVVVDLLSEDTDWLAMDWLI